MSGAELNGIYSKAIYIKICYAFRVYLYGAQGNGTAGDVLYHSVPRTDIS